MSIISLDTLVLPGQLRGQAELRFDQGTPAELVAQGDLTPTRQLLSWQVGGWDKLLQFELVSEGIQLHKPNITLAYSLLTSDWHSTLISGNSVGNFPVCNWNTLDAWWNSTASQASYS